MKITRLSSFAADILNRTSMGTVHSVYRRTVNLSLGGHILALQARRSTLSPISLLTDTDAPELGIPSLHPGTRIRVLNNRIAIEAPDPQSSASGAFENLYLLPFDPSASEDLYLSASVPAAGDLSLPEIIGSVIFSASPDGFPGIFQASQDIGSDLVRMAAAGHIQAAINAVHAGDPVFAAKELSSLVGVGAGLTPSGDDFLCGILAGLRLSGVPAPKAGCPSDPGYGRNLPETITAGSIEFLAPGFSKELHARIPEMLDRTNVISREFLQCALAGQFSEAVMHLTKAVSAESIRKEFGAIGHSSGYDTLCGIWFAFHPGFQAAIM